MKSVHTFRMAGTADSPLPIPTDLLVGTRWREAVGGRRFDVVDPSTGEHITAVANGGLADATAAVDAAEAAFEGGAATAPRKRAEILLACFNKIMESREWLAQLISLENGKALADARSEVTYAAEFFRWYAEEAVRVRGEFFSVFCGVFWFLVFFVLFVFLLLFF